MTKVTLLTTEQIWGGKALEAMKKYGTKVAPTDLAAILGAWMTGGSSKTSEGERTCYSWSASSSVFAHVRCVGPGSVEIWREPDERLVGVRPALPSSVTSKIRPSAARAGSVCGVDIYEYGEYPQTVADDVTAEELEVRYSRKHLSETGKKYTFDNAGLTDYGTSFQAKEHPEYEFGGKRYIRVTGKPADSDTRLSGGEYFREDKAYWVQVLPIEWLADKSGVWFTKKCLFAGIQFDTRVKYDGNFSKTFMKRYLDTYFSKEMEVSRTAARTLEAEDIKEETKQRKAEEVTVAEEKTEEKAVETADKSRVQKRAELEALKAEVRVMEADLRQTTEPRKKLAKKLTEIRKEFGHNAKSVAAKSKVVQDLRKKAER